MGRMRRRLVIGAGAALAVVGAGGAVAATQGSPAQESQAIIDDAAAELGIDAQKLEAALEEALAKRVDAAVADGRLTEEQGAALKERIRSGQVPLLGLRGGHGSRGGPGHHRGPGLDDAASYLGVTVAELREALADGRSLADVARAEGKAVDGLVDTLVAAAEARLADAVEAGRLTDAQRDEVVESLEQRIREGVNASGLRFRGGRGHHGGRGFGGVRPEAPPAKGPGAYRFGGGAEPPAAA